MMVYSERVLCFTNGYGMTGKYSEFDYIKVKSEGVKYIGLLVHIDKTSFDVELEDGDTISFPNDDVDEIVYLGETTIKEKS